MERPTDIGILPGMAGEVHVKVDSTGATRIPSAAIFEENGKPVYGVSGRQAWLRKPRLC